MKITFLSLFLLVSCYKLVSAQKFAPNPDKTILLVGQTYKAEYENYKTETGLTPIGSSHYGTLFTGTIEQGDDSPDVLFLDWVRGSQSNPYALVAISIKDNPSAGGYGQMVNPTGANFDANAIWQSLIDISAGNWDTQIDAYAKTMKDRPDTKFYLRIGYEVSLFLFAYRDEVRYNGDWLTEKAIAGINVFDKPSDFAELDPQAYINAYNHIANRIRNVNGVTNVDFVYHPVRGTNDTKYLYPGATFVDWVAFSVFNNDVCVDVNGIKNCEGKMVDENLQNSIDFAKSKGHRIMIAESSIQTVDPNSTVTDAQFIDYLSRLDALVKAENVGVLAYINSNWNAHGWGAEWCDSRIHKNATILNYYKNTFGVGTRYDGSVPTAINEMVATDGVTIVSTTGKNTYRIISNGSQYIDRVQVVNMSGVSVMEQKALGQNEILFDLSHSPSGIYIVRVVIEGKVVSKKILVN